MYVQKVESVILSAFRVRTFLPKHPSLVKVIRAMQDVYKRQVEDNESIKQMLVGIFETFYQVSTASDGVEALEMIQKDMPSIILSDVVMPRMSGKIGRAHV